MRDDLRFQRLKLVFGNIAFASHVTQLLQREPIPGTGLGRRIEQSAPKPSGNEENRHNGNDEDRAPEDNIAEISVFCDQVIERAGSNVGDEGE